MPIRVKAKGQPMPDLQPIIPTEEDVKHPLQSRTMIFNAVLGVLPFVFPRLYSFIAHLPPDSQVQVVSGFFAIVNIVLRFFTSARVSFKKSK
jgi:hypothetical protein